MHKILLHTLARGAAMTHFGNIVQIFTAVVVIRTLFGGWLLLEHLGVLSS